MSLENVEDAFALSPIQTGMLYDSLSTPNKDVYVTYVTVDVVGNVDTERLQRAWQAVFNIHQALRAEFHWDGLDQPLQVISKEITLPWETLDWSSYSIDQQNDLMQQLQNQERSNLIDISQAPLSRFNLIRLEQTRWRLLWSVHHLLADGLSTPTILIDVLDAYTKDQKSEINDRQVYQYSQHINWLGTQDQQAAKRYWKEQLADVSPSPTNLRAPVTDDPAGKSADNRTDKSEDTIPQVEFGLSKIQSDELITFCQSHRLTLSTFLHAAWALLIRNYSDSELSLFASTVSGRHSDISGMDKAVGLYLNAQPRKIATTSEKPLISWMQDLQNDIHNCAKYDFSQLRDIQEFIDKEKTETPFESIITIGGHPSELDISSETYDIGFTNIHYQSTQSHYALAFLAFPGDELEMSVVYEPERYYLADIQNMTQHLKALITAMITSSDATPDNLANRVATELINIPSSQQQTAGKGMATVHQWFESVVDENPDKPCLVFESNTVSFAQVDCKANQIAQLILQSVEPENQAPIGLMLPRCIEQIAGMLGILKAGYAYVPIDPAYPASTRQALIKDAGITHIISDGNMASEEISPSVRILTTQHATRLSEDRVQNIKCSSNDLAYVMYTSGSTGQPKGVQITHANLIYSTATRIDYYELLPTNFLLLSSIAFDSSVAGIYWSLCSGGNLVLPGPNQEKDIQAITDLIANESITHTLCLPSYYQLLLQHSDTQLLDSLRVVIVAGEECTTELVDQHFKLQSKAELYNEYGPTEACVWSSVYKLEDLMRGEIPIGKPVGSTYLQVINKHGIPCPCGIEGEIVIGGPGVSPGYYKNPAQTSERFLEITLAGTGNSIIYRTGDRGYFNENGELVFSGRIDRQLKIRGYRIEPGDIEAALNEHPEISKSVVAPLDQSLLAAREHTSFNRDETLETLKNNFSEQAIQQAIAELELQPLDQKNKQVGIA